MNDFRSSEFDRFVGDRLRLERRLAGMNREALAKLLGVSAATVEKYENGERRLPAQRLGTAAAALGIPISVFFYEGGRRVPNVVEHKRWLTIPRPPKTSGKTSGHRYHRLAVSLRWAPSSGPGAFG